MAWDNIIPNPNTTAFKVSLTDKNLVKRSASSQALPAEPLTPVAKLIDVSKCIGCKACQVACLEWNDLTVKVGIKYGSYGNPRDLTPNSFTVMRALGKESNSVRSSSRRLGVSRVSKSFRRMNSSP